jgi:hypothetical protein
MPDNTMSSSQPIHAMLERHGKDVEPHLLTQASGRKRAPSEIKTHELPGPTMADVLKAVAPLHSKSSAIAVT